jgi:hypothetical protein
VREQPQGVMSNETQKEIKNFSMRREEQKPIL